MCLGDEVIATSGEMRKHLHTYFCNQCRKTCRTLATLGSRMGEGGGGEEGRERGREEGRERRREGGRDAYLPNTSSWHSGLVGGDASDVSI